MTDNQENKLSMYLATQTVCNQYLNVWNTLPIAVTLFAEFESFVGLLQTATQQQELNRTGITKDKAGLRQHMVDIAYPFGQTLTAYANITGNNELAQAVSYVASDYTRAKDTIVKEMCEIVHTAATTELANLADYGITQEALDALDNAITDYADKIGAPRAAITIRKQATGSIRNLIAQTDDVLKNKLDKIMLQFRNTEFYPIYKSARIIIDRRGQRSNTPPEPPAPDAEPVTE